MDKTRIKNNKMKDKENMTMHSTLHPQGDVDWLYIIRNNGRKEMISLEDCVEMEGVGNLGGRKTNK